MHKKKQDSDLKSSFYCVKEVNIRNNIEKVDVQGSFFERINFLPQDE